MPEVEHVGDVVEIVGVVGAPKTGLVEKFVAADVHDPFPVVTAYVVPAVRPLINPPAPTEGPAGINVYDCDAM